MARKLLSSAILAAALTAILWLLVIFLPLVYDEMAWLKKTIVIVGVPLTFLASPVGISFHFGLNIEKLLLYVQDKTTIQVHGFLTQQHSIRDITSLFCAIEQSHTLYTEALCPYITLANYTAIIVTLLSLGVVSFQILGILYLLAYRRSLNYYKKAKYHFLMYANFFFKVTLMTIVSALIFFTAVILFVFNIVYKALSPLTITGSLPFGDWWTCWYLAVYTIFFAVIPVMLCEMMIKSGMKKFCFAYADNDFKVLRVYRSWFLPTKEIILDVHEKLQ